MRFKIITATTILSLAFGAGCGVDASSERNGTQDVAESSNIPEIVEGVRGKTYLRSDLWTAEELQDMEAKQDASLGPNPSLEEVAEGLRGVMRHHNGGIYIEANLDYELAEKVMKEDELALLDREETEATSEGDGVEDRHIINNDDRWWISNSGGNAWQAKTAFAEHGCSATRIGQHTAVTAAHCLYDTLVADDWICNNGATGTCTNWPDWRFGVNDTTGHSNWISCENVVISGNFDNLTSLATENDAWLFARRDFAVMDLSDCPSSSWPNGTSWMGTTILSNSSLSSLTANALGYPARDNCPAGSSGQNGTGCTTFLYNGSPAPFSGGELLVDDHSTISKGDSQSSYTIRSLADVTAGQSGGALYKYESSSGSRWLVGILSNGNSTENRYRRWTSSLKDWVAARSEFPDDT